MSSLGFQHCSRSAGFAVLLALLVFALAGPANAECTLGYCLPRDSHDFTILQPSGDSLIVYLSESEGNDQNQCAYYTNQIVGDVFNPTGTTSGPIRPCKTLAKGYSFLRNLKPDFLLLRKGDTWRNQSINVGGLGVSLQGRSPSEPIVFAAYGVGARPTFHGGGFNFGGNIASPGHLLVEVNNIVLKGFHFRPDFTQPRNNTFGGVGASPYYPHKNLLIEDVVVDHGLNLMTFDHHSNEAGGENARNLTLRRSVLTNAFSYEGYDVGGLYISGFDGLLIEGNLFDHNGWNEEFPLNDWFSIPNNNIAAWRAVTNGQFNTWVCAASDPGCGNSLRSVANLNFSAVQTMADVAQVLQSGINAQIGENAVTVTDFYWPFGGVHVLLFKGNRPNFTNASGFAAYTGSAVGTSIDGPEHLNAPGGWSFASRSGRSHHAYVQTGNRNVQVANNIFARTANDALACRTDCIIEGNLFVRNPSAIAQGNGSPPRPEGTTSLIRDNVILEATNIDAGLHGMGPGGSGIGVQNTNELGSIIENNIIANNISTGGYGGAIGLSALGGAGFVQGVGIRRATVRGNIVYNWVAMDIGFWAPLVSSQALQNISIENNILQSTNANSYSYNVSTQSITPSPGVISFSGNTYFSNRSHADPFFATDYCTVVSSTVDASGFVEATVSGLRMTENDWYTPLFAFELQTSGQWTWTNGINTSTYSPLTGNTLLKLAWSGTGLIPTGTACRLSPVSSVQGITFPKWQQFSNEPGAQFEQVPFSDPGRTLATYHSNLHNLPGSSLEAFLQEAAMFSADNYRPELLAPAVNAYIREGFQVCGASGCQAPPRRYTIAASASSHGSINPTGNVVVNQGASIQFIITPDSGYEITQVIANGTTICTSTCPNSYTFNNLQSNGSISVGFSLVSAGSSSSSSSTGSIGPIATSSVSVTSAPTSSSSLASSSPPASSSSPASTSSMSESSSSGAQSSSVSSVNVSSSGSSSSVGTSPSKAITAVVTVPRTIEGSTSNPGKIVIQRSGSISQALSVYYTIGGSARNGSDYRRLSGVATIARNKRSVTIRVEALRDRIQEPLEDVVLTFLPNAQYSVIGQQRARVEIVNRRR